MPHRARSLLASSWLALGVAACGSYTAADGRDTYVAMVRGEEVALVEPEDVTRAMADRASALLPCPAREVTIEAHAYWSTQYWSAEGCGLKTLLAIAHRCPPDGERVCAATIVPITDGDPSASLDPDMRRQSGDVVGMAYLVSLGAVDLVCPPSQVRLDSFPYPVPMTVVRGCGRRAGYVFQNGGYQRVPL
jgi:hypothetical protein